MYIQRSLESFFLKANSHFPVLMVVGPRQVGKTTFLRSLAQEDRKYVTLDDPIQRELATRDPALFLQRFSPPVLIDEIQYAPALLPYIKIAVDNTKIPGQFWLTGSQQFHLMKGVSESLAGRVAIHNLLGLSFRELVQDHHAGPFVPSESLLQNRLSVLGDSLDLQTLYNLIWLGSFPGLAALQNDKDVDRDLFYTSYIQTYLQRDIRDLTRVGDEMAFMRFIRACAGRSGQMLNVADLARDVDIALNTAKSWLSILQASGIIFLLEPYHNNFNKRLVKSPKLYFLDTGLASFLTGWTSAQTLEAGAMSGQMLETWVVSEILKSFWHNGKSAPLFYFRNKDKKEVDLLIVQDGKIYPLEIKKTASPQKNHVVNFKALSGLQQEISYGGLICLKETLMPLASENIQIIPIGAL